jgi:sulfoxide reductase heme-binding subunit YedZ
MSPPGVIAVTSPALWYTTRGAGLVCLVLFTAAVVLGVLNVSRWSRPSWPRFATLAIHRNISLIALLVLAIHIISAELDTFAPIGWLALVIPFASSYRPIWLGLGTVASDLFIAVVVTSLLRDRIGHRVWRAIHWAGYAAWPVAVLHGLGTGTDPKLGWVQLLTAVCVAAVIVATGWRVAHSRPVVPGARAGLGVVGAVGVVAAAVWTYTGPLQPGWARRAGTPSTLLASSRAASSKSPASSSTGQPATTPSSTTPAAGLPALPFEVQMAGHVAQQGPDQSGHVAVQINGRLSGAMDGSLSVLIGGQAADGGVSMASSSVAFGPAGDPRRFRGQVVALDGEQLVAVVEGNASGRLELTATLNIDPQAGSVTGTVRVSNYSGGGFGH